MTGFRAEDMRRLAEIVRQATGNRVDEKNFSMLESRLRGHLLRLGLDGIEDYWRHYSEHEADERVALTGLMTTHYTFFFREYVHFELLGDWIERESGRLRARWEKTKRPLRIWSAAASTGQEAYSLAMFVEQALRSHGVGFEIVGTDIDADSVAFAANGVYPMKQVNTIPQGYLSRNWKRGTGPVSEFASVHPRLRERMRFAELNLLDVDRWNERESFDVIFCRNCFIYFSEPDVRKIALSLVRRLEPNGLFVSGVSETLRFDGWTLASLGPSCYLNAPRVTEVKPAEPLAPAVAAVPVAIAAPARAPSKYRVLCVDDSTTIQSLLRRIFGEDSECALVETALNGREAREKLDRQKFDLVTLDIHMPEVNGIEFLEKLYRKDRDPPVLMLSSVNRADLDLAVRAIELGAFDYVEKPAMNKLAESAEEIRTKARLALRARRAGVISDAAERDSARAAGRNIVVPDASQCLRLVYGAGTSLAGFAAVVRGQRNEARSPAIVLVAGGGLTTNQLERLALEWTDNKIAALREGTGTLRPNTLYVADAAMVETLLPSWRAKQVSAQFLDLPTVDVRALGAVRSLQVLFDERLEASRAQFEKSLGLRVSDLTPPTSFASLSVEFFARVRKAAA